MTGASTLGLLLVVAMALLGGVLISQLRVRRPVRRLVLAGYVLRIAGGLTYLFLIGGYYGGGDYLLYFREGSELAASAFTGGPGSIWDPAIWTEGRWWGTYFVARVTGLLFVGTGPTLPGAFIVFSLVSYLGIVAMGWAFHRAYPHIPLERYLVWIVLFPSLWFWPTALGKDAIVLCGVGLAALGFVGKRNHPNWLLMAFGVALVFMIRPQVAATLVFALMMAQWLGSGLRWTPMRMLQGVLFLAVGVGVVSLAGGALGLELFSPEEVEGYLDSRAAVSARGGSAIGGEGSVAPWLAPINTLFRPFPWEAGGVTSLLASLEVVVLWAVAWRRRQEIKAFVRAHRKTRLFWLAVVFVVVYATALGMSLSNIGIIARQRVHILPFVFLFFAGAGGTRKRRVRAPLLQTHRARSAVGQPVG
jgi:hypothetical protein